MSAIMKAWRLLATPFFWFGLVVSWFLLSLYLLVALQEYREAAAVLAGLDNQQGATVLLLVPGGQAVQWLMVVWSVFYLPRLFAGERQWSTFYLRRTSLQNSSWAFVGYLLVMWFALLLLTLPFWILTLALASSVAWDQSLLFSLLLLQLVFAVYAVLLSAALSVWANQIMTAMLFVAIAWLLLWILPVLTSTPEWLVMMLRWLSPFSHLALLQSGTLSLQSGIFILAHAAFFLTWTYLGWRVRR